MDLQKIPHFNRFVLTGSTHYLHVTLPAMINIPAPEFQQLDLEGVKTLTTWAQAEGWNPGLHDAEVFYATDPNGFYGYFREGSLIAGGSVVAYGDAFGFMGFFIVKPEFRASGIGRQLWYQRRNKLMSRLCPGAPIGMDGVVAMQPFYHKGGFDIAFRDERHERLGQQFDLNPNISAICADDLINVLAMDQHCFGYSRPQFLLPWLSMASAKTFKLLDHGVLAGFAVLRKCNTGYKIGPLFAKTAGAGEELYKACLNAVPGEPVFIDIPMVNTAATDLVRRYDTTFVFECARMYLNGPPAADMSCIFGITSFELG